MSDLITLNLVENRRIVRRYQFSFEALRLNPEYAELMDNALGDWMRREPARRVYADYRGMAHIVGAQHGA